MTPSIDHLFSKWARSGGGVYESKRGKVFIALITSCRYGALDKIYTACECLYTDVPLGVFMPRKGQGFTILRNQYLHEAYSVIQKLRSERIKPYTANPQPPTILSIPLEGESQPTAN